MTLPKPGDVLLDKYRIEAVLGEGGYGRVYQATTLTTERPVAIKVLKTGTSLEATSRVSRFLREMRAIAKLKSPHTITLFDYGRLDDGAPFMVCEFVGGEDLYELLLRLGPLPAVQAVHILEQILRSLGEAHAVGILHRDVKPSNVRVHEFGDDPLSVKMLDFGLAKSLIEDEARLTGTGNVVGTPRYMSPEQIHGRPLTPASDIYSAGLVAVEMIIGSEAFRGLPVMGERLLDASLPVDSRVVAVVNRMVTDDPSRRWQQVGDVLDALNSEGPLPAHPVRRVPTIPPGQRPEPPGASASRGPLLLAIGGLLSLAVLGGLIVGTTTVDEDEPTAPAPAVQVEIESPIVRSEPQVTREPPIVAPDASEPSPGTVGCGGKPMAGAREISVLDGLSARSLMVHIPDSYDPDVPHPMLLLLHESAVNPREFIKVSGFIPIAEREGIVIAAPWGGAPEAWEEDTYLAARDAVEDVQQDLCIDPQRVFAVGHSSGGSVAEMAGCRLPGIRAIATTAYRRSTDGKPGCMKVPIPALHLTGREDRYNPLAGGKSCSGAMKIPLALKEERWVRRNDCAADERKTWLRKGASTCVSWESCQRPLVSCVLDGGRGWNGSGDRLWDIHDCDGTPADFPYAETIWSFFESLDP